jgi:hypothetical protein
MSCRGQLEALSRILRTACFTHFDGVRSVLCIRFFCLPVGLKLPAAVLLDNCLARKDCGVLTPGISPL